MPLRYYSQTGEDALLWNIFGGSATGRFIDIGAFDGRYLSNSLLFEEQGWTGICIEAHPDYFHLCKRNRLRSICVQAACVEPGRGPMTEFFSEPLGILSGVRAFETPNMQGRYAARNMIFPGFTELQVPARTIDDIVEEYCPGLRSVDFISVDVEGTEVEVLRGCSVHSRVIVAEANTDDARKALIHHMGSRGYTFARALEQNYFFGFDSDVVNRLRTAKFDITTEPILHPLGADATPPHHTGKRICLG